MDYKGYRLPRDLGLLTGLFFLLIYYSLLLRFKSLPDILAALRKNIDQGSLVEARLEDRQVLDKLWRGCSFILIRIFRTKKPCLRRALVLYSWCCKRFKPLILEFSHLFSCFHRITVNPNSLSGCYLITPTWPASLDSPWIRLHKGTGEGDGRRYQWFSCPSLPWNFTTTVKAKPLTRLPAMSSAKWLT